MDLSILKNVNVLDKGFVRLVDFMGSDLRVCEAARVSTGSIADKGDEANQKLINYLYKNNHDSPFEKVVFEFHIKCPIFVARQWHRHRTQSFNEASARYKEFTWECYQPEVWRHQDVKNKQGSSLQDLYGDYEQDGLTDDMNAAYRTASKFYYDALHKNVTREQARTVMPVGQYTEFFATIKMRNLFEFLMLRMHDHAQFEIREYANALRDIITSIKSLKFSVEVFDKMQKLRYTFAKAVNKDMEGLLKYLEAFVEGE